jgi:hypothetical protein
LAHLAEALKYHSSGLGSVNYCTVSSMALPIMVLCGTVSATRHSRGSGNPGTHSSNGPLVHGEALLGPRLRGDDELSSKLFARHYTRSGYGFNSSYDT